MVTKTRDKLIDVARQLFARKGVENTTMNDIAEASKKGRRTIYTYFRNKLEIYRAVVEEESDSMVKRLREVANSPLDPERKVREFFEQRCAIARAAASERESWLSIKLEFATRGGMVRRLVRDKETELLGKILDEGVAKGVFDGEQASRLLAMERLVFLGLYRAYREAEEERQTRAPKRPVNESRAIDFFVTAILRHDQCQSNETNNTLESSTDSSDFK